MKKWMMWIFVFTLASLSASAAMVTGVFEGSVLTTTSFNLTTNGAADWAYWSTGSVSGAPVNKKADGQGLFSSVTVIGTGALAVNTTTPTGARFDYTDGTSPVSATDAVVFGVYDNTFELGNGVSVSMTLPTTGIYTIKFFAIAYSVTAKLTASLPDAENFVDTNFIKTGKGKQSGYYTLTVQADHPGDVLKLDLTTDVIHDQYPHVSIMAIAASVTASARVELFFIQN
jgi:hypothetical protein